MYRATYPTISFGTSDDINNTLYHLGLAAAPRNLTWLVNRLSTRTEVHCNVSLLSPSTKFKPVTNLWDTRSYTQCPAVTCAQTETRVKCEASATRQGYK